HGVATAVSSVAGRTVGIESLLTRMTIRLGCPETQDITGNVVDLRTDNVRPRHHECLAPVTDGGLDLLRCSAPLPGATAQVGEQVGLALGICSVTHGAVAIEDACSHPHHLFV